MSKLSLVISIAFAILLSSCGNKPANLNIYSADLIIYGGTSAAVTAAVEAIQSGKTVLVVSPDTPFGRSFFRRSGVYRYGRQIDHWRSFARVLSSGLAALQRFGCMEMAETFGFWQQRSGNSCNGRREPYHVDFRTSCGGTGFRRLYF